MINSGFVGFVLRRDIFSLLIASSCGICLNQRYLWCLLISDYKIYQSNVENGVNAAKLVTR